MKIKWNTSQGFTLIEIIITIVIASILGTVIYQYMGSSLVRSSEPIFRLQKTLSLKQVAENITADFNKNYRDDLPGLRTKIGEVSSTPKSNIYGDYSVVYNDYVQDLAANSDNSPGSETDPTKQKLLKVTIKNEENTITMLFITF
jgi:prepilin-type N-terminal cleavage/methylation domain-containing protein